MVGELIFCWTNCLVVDTTGILVDGDETIAKVQHRPMHLQCKHCRAWICMPVNRTMVSGFLDEPNKFRRTLLPKLAEN